MKKIMIIFSYCLVLLFGCSTKDITSKLKGTYTSNMISDLEGVNTSGQLQLSFDEKGNIYLLKSSNLIETGSFKQDERFEDVYAITLKNNNQIITLKDDNSFYLQYEDANFAATTIHLQFSMDALLGPSDTIEE